MKNYSGYQWLLIDAASQFGHDKLNFDKRIEWTEANLQNLEALADEAETKPLYMKAVLAIRKAQKGLPTGHMVGVDGCCSGVQIMSALTGCVAGARATGMVDPDRRADAYSQTTDEMNTILGGGVAVSRSDAKRALMTSFYGSKATPKEVFGEDTPELKAFYEAAMIVAPGAWELLQTLLASWQSFALQHDWKLPDGYDAVVRVMEKREVRIEVDELDHASFSYEFYENQGTKRGRANAANCVHSVDAYVLREMHRRCNYDREVMEEAERCIAIELAKRNGKGKQADASAATEQVHYYMQQYSRSTLASSVIFPHINAETVQALSTEHLDALLTMAEGILSHKPFPLVTVHDEFKAHANNVNQVRWHYKEILAEIADSNLLDDLLTQIHKDEGSYPKLSFNLGDLIRESSYALC